MPTAQYKSGDGREATLDYPEGYEAPRIIAIPRKNLSDNGTTQQYFYKEDPK
jgi:hypothetical protein